MHTLRLLWAARNEEMLHRRQKNVSLRYLQQINEMPDVLFRKQFRLDKKTFIELCHELRCHTSLRGTKQIPLEVKVLCTLSFLATGSYQRIIGLSQHLPQRTASRCITQVVDVLNSDHITSKWIVFPQTLQDRTRIRQEFERRFHLPGVIGCIDCTHIALVKPSENEHQFYNRKGYHSLNVQMVCDYDLRIMNVNAKYGGATHDAFIWAASQVEPYMRRLHQSGEQTWLIGDTGYPQRAWLMTPIPNSAPGSQEEIYTKRHILTRNCIERCFGLLKARWRCLLKHRTLHYHPHVAQKIILACCVLHNIALNARLPPPSDMSVYMAEQDDNDYDSDNDSSIHADSTASVASSRDELISGRAMLQCLVNRM